MSTDHHIPLDKDKIIEEYEEALLKLAMTSYAERDGKQLIQENELLRTDPFYQPTEEAKRKFKKNINKYYRNQQMKNIFHLSYKVLNKVAVVFSISCIIFSLSFVTVEAVRNKVLNLFINMQEEYTELHLGSKDNRNIVGNNIYINWNNAYAPTYIPSGYSIHNLMNNKDFKAIEYTNKNEETIIFQQMGENGNTNIDTENADKVEKIKIRGHEGLLVEKDGLITVTWNTDLYIFLINAQMQNLKNEDILKMAESVTLIK